MRWFFLPVGLLLAALAGLVAYPSTPAAACPFPSAPIAYEGPIDRSLYMKTIELAAYDLLFPGDPYFGLPPIERGTRANRSTDAPRQVPAVLLKAISWIESLSMQASLSTRFSATGPALISFDCGHGIMQVTSGMTRPLGEKGLPTLQQALVATHFAYNIARGAWILADKWNRAPENAPIAGTDTDGDPTILENWYFAVWAYNGFTGPGDSRSNHPLDPIYGSWPRPPFSCGPADDGLGHDRSRYPYQELVFGCAANPPQINGVRLWEPQVIHLPDLNDPRWKGPLSLENFQEPYSKMDIPTPGSPPPTPTITPTPTPTPASGGIPSASSLSTSTRGGPRPTPTLTGPRSGPPGHRDTTPRPDPSLRAQILGDPRPSLSADRVTITFTAQGRPEPATVQITNTGSGLLAWMALPTEPWLTVKPLAGVALDSTLSCAESCQRTGSLTISVDPEKLPPGRQQGTVQVLTPHQSGAAPLTITVTVESQNVAVPLLRRFHHPLVRGWNLVSIPVEPPDPAPQAVFKEISQSLQAAFAYDGKAWRAFSPSVPDASDLQEIRPGMGLWLRLNAPEELVISGPPPPSTTVLTLEEGWNLIGFPGLKPLPIAEALRSIVGDYGTVYSYESARGRWLAFSPQAPALANDLIQFEPGHGYWIRASRRVTWACPCGETAPSPSAVPSSTTPTPTATPRPLPAASATLIPRPTRTPTPTPP